MLRILGAALLVGVSVYLCIVFSTLESRRVRQTEGFLLLLRYIRTQIACFRTPVAQIYAGFEHAALRECGFLDALEAGGLLHALGEARGRLYLEDEELKLLLAFAGEIGQSYSDEEISLCDYTLAQLEKAMEKRREEAPRRTRVLHSLVLTSGFMLLFLLL